MNSPRVLTATVVGEQLGDHDRLAPPVPWWSLTKTALAAGALTLVADGRLALDAPLLPKPYTLRQLLQHTAGVPNYGDLVEYHEAVELFTYERLALVRPGDEDGPVFASRLLLTLATRWLR